MRSVETVLLLVVLGTTLAVFAGRLQIPAPRCWWSRDC
jgi:hypothetical protein